MSYMSQKLWAVASSLVELIHEYAHDKSNKAKKFIITHQFTQLTDFEYQTSVRRKNKKGDELWQGFFSRFLDMIGFLELPIS